MFQDPITLATLIYFDDEDLIVHSETRALPVSHAGRVIIPQELKEGRSILAVCDGEVNVLNKLGDRIVPK